MKRMNQFVYALLIGCVLLTGCGSNTNTTETKEEVISDSQANASTEATQSESASEEENDSVTGRIESIDEISITLAVMNMSGGAAPDGNGGGDKPSGEAPDGNGGGLICYQDGILICTCRGDAFIGDRGIFAVCVHCFIRGRGGLTASHTSAHS